MSNNVFQVLGLFPEPICLYSYVYMCIYVFLSFALSARLHRAYSNVIKSNILKSLFLAQGKAYKCNTSMDHKLVTEKVITDWHHPIWLFVINWSEPFITTGMSWSPDNDTDAASRRQEQSSTSVKWKCNWHKVRRHTGRKVKAIAC